MELLDRITHNPQVMGGKACIRGLRVTVGMILGMLRSGHTAEELLDLYPYLEPDDIRAAREFAQAQEREQSRLDETDCDRHEPLSFVVREAPKTGR